MIRVFDDDLLLDQLFGLALDLNMFLSKRLLPITHNLILKVIKSERIAHDEPRLGNCRPFGFEGDGEVANAVSLDREGA